MMPSSEISMENTEIFIDLVRQYPSVFDASCPKHKDAQRVRLCDIIGDKRMGGHQR